MMRDDGRFVKCCQYNKWVDCGFWVGSTKYCDNCGWNPEEYAARKELMEEPSNWKTIEKEGVICRSLSV